MDEVNRYGDVNVEVALRVKSYGSPGKAMAGSFGVKVLPSASIWQTSMEQGVEKMINYFYFGNCSNTGNGD